MAVTGGKKIPSRNKSHKRSIRPSPAGGICRSKDRWGKTNGGKPTRGVTLDYKRVPTNGAQRERFPAKTNLFTPLWTTEQRIAAKHEIDGPMARTLTSFSLVDETRDSHLTVGGTYGNTDPPFVVLPTSHASQRGDGGTSPIPASVPRRTKKKGVVIVKRHSERLTDNDLLAIVQNHQFHQGIPLVVDKELAFKLVQDAATPHPDGTFVFPEFIPLGTLEFFREKKKQSLVLVMHIFTGCFEFVFSKNASRQYRLSLPKGQLQCIYQGTLLTTLAHQYPRKAHLWIAPKKELKRLYHEKKTFPSKNVIIVSYESIDGSKTILDDHKEMLQGEHVIVSFFALEAWIATYNETSTEWIQKLESIQTTLDGITTPGAAPQSPQDMGARDNKPGVLEWRCEVTREDTAKILHGVFVKYFFMNHQQLTSHTCATYYLLMAACLGKTTLVANKPQPVQYEVCTGELPITQKSHPAPKEGEPIECPVCQEDHTQKRILRICPNGHHCCQQCFLASIDVGSTMDRCAICRQTVEFTSFVDISENSVLDTLHQKITHSLHPDKNYLVYVIVHNPRMFSSLDKVIPQLMYLARSNGVWIQRSKAWDKRTHWKRPDGVLIVAAMKEKSQCESTEITQLINDLATKDCAEERKVLWVLPPEETHK